MKNFFYKWYLSGCNLAKNGSKTMKKKHLKALKNICIRALLRNHNKTSERKILETFVDFRTWVNFFFSNFFLRSF